MQRRLIQDCLNKMVLWTNGYHYGYCRNCPHFHTNKMSCIAYRVVRPPNTNCDCNEWLPLDNLEYLEWRIDVRQTKISTNK